MLLEGYSRSRRDQEKRNRQSRLRLESLEGRWLFAVGPELVADINKSELGSNPSGLVQVGSSLYFSADDGASGVELWKSDGTARGTVRVKDINSGGGSSHPAFLTDVGGTLYFQANDGGLWKSDGTESSTVRVKHINLGGGSGPSYLTNVNGTLFFAADDGTSGIELWKSDGTESGTVQVKDIWPGRNPQGDNFDGPRNLTNVGGTLYFTTNDGISGVELWKSDGTETGTVRVRDINPGDASSFGNSYSRQFAAAGDTLYFVANDGTSGSELWRSTGTESSTVRVKDIWQGTNGSMDVRFRRSNVGLLRYSNGTLYFTADDGTTGLELWTSDGTETGTLLLMDFVAGTDGSNPSGLIDVHGALFFTTTGASQATSHELWKTDGTVSGTVLVKEFTEFTYSDHMNLTNVAGTLFFTALAGDDETVLWKSDGTEAGTYPVSDSFPKNLTNLNGTIYFTYNDGIHGPELWGLRTVAPLGDANRDGRFDTTDLVFALQGGKYETQEPAVWSEGDWNGDGVFDSGDLIRAFQTGRYEQVQAELPVRSVFVDDNSVTLRKSTGGIGEPADLDTIFADWELKAALAVA